MDCIYAEVCGLGMGVAVCSFYYVVGWLLGADFGIKSWHFAVSGVVGAAISIAVDN